MKYVTRIGDREYHVEILDDHRLLLDGKPYEIDFTSIGDQPVYSLLIDGRSFEAHAVPGEEGWQVLLHGKMYEVCVEDEEAIRARSLARPTAQAMGEYQLRSPMPGLVVAVPAVVGAVVEKGDPLVILESMKMQNELRSQKAGTVQEIRAQIGQTVEQNQVLVIVV